LIVYHPSFAIAGRPVREKMVQRLRAAEMPAEGGGGSFRSPRIDLKIGPAMPRDHPLPLYKKKQEEKEVGQEEQEEKQEKQVDFGVYNGGNWLDAFAHSQFVLTPRGTSV
jgi:hypothetical protein